MGVVDMSVGIVRLSVDLFDTGVCGKSDVVVVLAITVNIGVVIFKSVPHGRYCESNAKAKQWKEYEVKTS